MAIDRPVLDHQRIGRMRDNFEFQLPPTARDTLGERESGTWVKQFDSRAALRALRGLTFVEGQSLNTQFTHTITIRYRAGIQGGMRALDKRTNVLYDVRDVENVASKNRWLVLRCVAQPQPATT